MGLTVGLRFVSVSLIAQDVRSSTLAECERVAEMFEAQLNLRMRALEHIANHLGHSPGMSEEYFRGYTRQIMSQTTGISAVSVTDVALAPLLVETPLELGLPDFTEMVFAEPMASAFVKARDRSLKEKSFAITDPIHFTGLGSGFAAITPFYQKEELRGFIVGVFVYETIAATVIPESSREFNIRLLQWNTQMNAPAYQRMDPVIASVPSKKIVETAEIPRFLGSQKWVVQVEPSGTEAPYRGKAPVLFTSGSILVLGSILAVILSIVLYRQQAVADRSMTEARDSRTKLDSTSDHLARIREELDLILNHVDEAIVLYDDEMRPLQANAAFRLAFASHGQKKLLQQPADVHHRQMAETFQNESQYWALVNNLRESPELPFTDEIDLRDDGTGAPARFYQRRSTAVLAPDGSRRGYLVIYRDISKERAIERLKEDFLSSVTHDLRTPLASIRGFAETMLRDEEMKPETRSEFTNIICDESARLQDMIEDLLDLRRMEGGQGEMEPASFNFRNLVEEVLNTSHPIFFFPRDIGVDLQWEGDSSASFYGDVGMMSRAIRNVLSNSAKYSPRRSKVHIKGTETSEKVELEIVDEGPGVPPEDLPHLFEKFYRGWRHARRTKGTGLGLAIVKHIVESHGGIVVAENVEHKGTKIKFVLPRRFETAPVLVEDSADEAEIQKGTETESEPNLASGVG